MASAARIGRNRLLQGRLMSTSMGESIRSTGLGPPVGCPHTHRNSPAQTSALNAVAPHPSSSANRPGTSPADRPGRPNRSSPGSSSPMSRCRRRNPQPRTANPPGPRSANMRRTSSAETISMDTSGASDRPGQTPRRPARFRTAGGFKSGTSSRGPQARLRLLIRLMTPTRDPGRAQPDRTGRGRRRTVPLPPDHPVTGMLASLRRITGPGR